MDIEKITERFNQVAEKYDEQRRFFIPCFDDYYITSISFLSNCRNDFKSILDLGAGTGLLTKYLIERFPSALYTLVDISEQMMDIAKSRFKNNKNIEYIISDYSKIIPQKKFALIASALSIHHLENELKINLYSMIYDNLENGGYLINLDQFNSNSEIINNNYIKWWYKYIKDNKISEKDRESWIKRRELDIENTVDDTKSILIRAGFKNVDCIYSYMNFGVILAIK